MVSEHASPLATPGGPDAGGQNVHVAELSAALARRGHHVEVYTRRDDPDLPDRVDTEQGYTVVHVPAGPPRHLPKDELLQYMGSFGRYLDDQWDDERPDIAHAHFWMSGIATQLAAKRRGCRRFRRFTPWASSSSGTWDIATRVPPNDCGWRREWRTRRRG